MKSIIFIILIIISFSAISSKNLRAQKIFKGSRNHPPSNPYRHAYLSNRNRISVTPVSFGPPIVRSPHASPQTQNKNYTVYSC